jgi:NTE family protein
MAESGRNPPIQEATQKTAWVLSGGGSLGAVQVGMLAELIAEGVRPDFIVGVSAGALNGAFLAHNPCADTVTRMATLWSEITTREALGLSWRSMLGMLGLRDHVASAQGLRNMLLRELPYRSFSESSIPLHLVCTDLITREEVVISAGEVIEAVIASTAIPGVFPSVLYHGRHLVDGAVSASTPISVAVRLGATRVIVLPCGFACATNTIPKRPWGRAMHAITLMGARQLLRDFEHYSQSIIVSIAPFTAHSINPRTTTLMAQSSLPVRVSRLVNGSIRTGSRATTSRLSSRFTRIVSRKIIGESVRRSTRSRQESQLKMKSAVGPKYCGNYCRATRCAKPCREEWDSVCRVLEGDKTSPLLTAERNNF